MSNDRITRYMQQQGGGRMLGLCVRGIKVSVQPSDADQQAAADALAEEIAALGPEGLLPVVPPPPAVRSPSPPARVPFVVGEHVWCNVHGAEGWHTVVEVGEGRRRGEIKITGCRAWCPAHNFAREERRHG